MIHVIASIQVQPGKRAALLDTFRALVPIVRREVGCIEYGTAVDIETGIERQLPVRADVVTVVEKWESVSALEAHLATDHMKTFREQVGSILAGLEIRILQPDA